MPARNSLTKSNQYRPILNFHSELRAGISAAEAYQPSLVMVELSGDLEIVRALIEESIAVAPEATVVGVYGAENLPSGLTESGLMLRALRLGVEDFIRRPIATTDLNQLLSRRLEQRRDKKQPTGHLVSFVSNKGGVGKSTASVNVAVELARRNPDRVLLIDGSLQMGVCATQLNLKPNVTLVDAWNQRDRLDKRLLRELTTVHESRLHLLAAPENAVDAAEIDDAFMSRILLLGRRSYDYVVVDTFPLFDRTIMAILDLSDLAVIVVENVVPTLQTVRGFFSLLSEVEYPRAQQRVLLNRYSTRAGGPNVQEVSRYLGRDADYLIPFDRKVVQAANTGSPFISSGLRWNKAANAIRAIADEIEDLSSADADRRRTEDKTGGGYSASSERDEFELPSVVADSSDNGV